MVEQGNFLAVSLREFRIVVERLLMLTGLHKGLIPAVREFILAAELAGAGALQFIRDELITVDSLPLPRIVPVRERQGVLEVDCSEHYAPVVAPNLLNLLHVRANRYGAAAILARHVGFPKLLRGLILMAERRGLASIVITPDGTHRLNLTAGLANHDWPIVGSSGKAEPGVCNLNRSLLDMSSALVIALPVSRGDQLVSCPCDVPLPYEYRRALSEGVRVDAELWWCLYHHSNRALTPTSEISRRHAGPALDTLFVEW